MDDDSYGAFTIIKLLNSSNEEISRLLNGEFQSIYKSRSYNFGSLPAGNYTVKIVAWDGGGNSKSVYLPIVATAPDPPTGLTLFNESYPPYATWDPNDEPDFKRYKIYWSTTSGSPYENFKFIDNPSYQFTLEDIEEVTTYYVVVSAFDYANNESNFSLEKSMTTKLRKPSNFIANAIDYTNIKLRWKNTSNYNTGFKIQYGIGGYPNQIVIDDPTTEEIIIGNLTSSEYYQFRIQAKDNQGHISDWVTCEEYTIPLWSNHENCLKKNNSRKIAFFSTKRNGGGLCLVEQKERLIENSWIWC
jgi:hypothetical protein